MNEGNKNLVPQRCTIFHEITKSSEYMAMVFIQGCKFSDKV